MLTGKELQNTWLLSVTDGKKLGEIKDLYLDSGATQVAAVFLGREGMINRKSLVVERAAIQLFGIDAWLVNGSDKVMPMDDKSGLKELLFMDDLRGREIETDGGTKIGTVGDVIVDEQARVLGFTLGKNHIKGALAEKKGIVRAAFVDLGDKERPAILDLPKAEAANLEE
jgi:uncharacterized protein YrrD